MACRLGFVIATVKTATVMKATSRRRRNQASDFQNGYCLNGDCIITTTVRIATLLSTSE